MQIKVATRKVAGTKQFIEVKSKLSRWESRLFQDVELTFVLFGLDIVWSLQAGRSCIQWSGL